MAAPFSFLFLPPLSPTRLVLGAAEPGLVPHLPGSSTWKYISVPACTLLLELCFTCLAQYFQIQPSASMSAPIHKNKLRPGRRPRPSDRIMHTMEYSGAYPVTVPRPPSDIPLSKRWHSRGRMALLIIHLSMPRGRLCSSRDQSAAHKGGPSGEFTQGESEPGTRQHL